MSAKREMLKDYMLRQELEKLKTSLEFQIHMKPQLNLIWTLRHMNLL
jgi:hypothetical protein